MARILICGMTTADFVFGVHTMPERAEKYVANTAKMIIGGGAANAAIAIARQQGSASLAARIGDDWVGKAIMQTLDGEKIDCSFLHVCKHATTSFSSVLIDATGERQIVNFRGAGFDEQPHWLTSDTLPEFRESEHDNRPFDGVLTDTRWTTGAVAVLQMARRAGVPGVVDAEAPMSDRILNIASHVAFSKQGLTAYTEIENTEEALVAAKAKLDAWVCVTDGSNGVFHLQDGKMRHTPTHCIEIKDTLAAGDVWHGVFTLGLSEGQDEQSAIEYANAAATLKCAGLGGSMAAPTREQTLQLMQQKL
ncbi:MAG: sulfofructose kinase [Granulosicoccus sp.]|jgi:sulfofructose kinase